MGYVLVVGGSLATRAPVRSLHSPRPSCCPISIPPRPRPSPLAPRPHVDALTLQPYHGLPMQTPHRNTTPPPLSCSRPCPQVDQVTRGSSNAPPVEFNGRGRAARGEYCWGWDDEA